MRHGRVCAWSRFLYHLLTSRDLAGLRESALLEERKQIESAIDDRVLSRSLSVLDRRGPDKLLLLRESGSPLGPNVGHGCLIERVGVELSAVAEIKDGGSLIEAKS